MNNTMKDEGWMMNDMGAVMEEPKEAASGYQRLEIWQLARDLSVQVHQRRVVG